METLKKKWNSRRGASILLALLFLLVCMMAGASILMAAASNAGKIRSNQEEQQKYLTVSSALNLLCDELESVEYVGIYTYESHQCDDEDVECSGGYTGTHHFYKQRTGELRARTDAERTLPETDWTQLADVLPLRERLDDFFVRNFRVPAENREDGYDMESLEDQLGVGYNPYRGTYTLDFKVDGTAYGGLSETVRIIVELRNDGSIVLNATLMKDDDVTDYAMMALLQPDPNDFPEKRLVLSNSPVDGENTTLPIRWMREYIAKSG